MTRPTALPVVLAAMLSIPVFSVPIGVAFVGLAGTAGAQEAAVVHNGTEPAQAARTLRLQEVWRIDDEGELLLGSIADVACDAGGKFYLLDQPGAQLHILSPDGKHLRSIGRQGEGPGETRDPIRVLFLPDSSIGVVQASPGKIVKFSRDGIPTGDIVPGGTASRGMGFLAGAQSRGGNIVTAREEMRQIEGGMTRTRMLAGYGEDGREKVRYYVRDFPRVGAGFKWDEAADYFPFMGRYAVGPDGRVYCAPERDRYLIHVYTPDGRLERIIDRDFERRKRSAEEKRQVGESMRMVINGREIEKEVAEYDPCILGLRVDERNRVWVVNSRSAGPQTAGVLAEYDVFDPQGVFTQRVRVIGEGDAREDRLFLFGDRAVLVRGATDRLVARVGDGGLAAEGDLGAEPLAVICYRIVE